MLRCTVPVLITVLAFTPMLSAQEPIRIFVKPADTAIGGFVDEETKRLADSREDFLAQFKKTKGIELVDRTESADVTLQIASSVREDFGVQSTTLDRGFTGAIVGSTTHRPERPTVRVKLSAGDYETVIAEGSMNWKLAAAECVRTVRRWITDNRATLVAKRAQETR